MGRVKINRTGGDLVKYSPEHWELLDNLRKQALKVTSVFAHQFPHPAGWMQAVWDRSRQPG